MPADSEKPPVPHANPPTVSVILSIAVAIIILICIYAARRTSALVVIRETVSGRRRIPQERQGLGREALQSIPVVKYNEELLAEHTGPGRVRVSRCTRILQAIRFPKPSGNNAGLPARRTWYSPRPRPTEPIFYQQNQSRNSCAICTEDFVHGVDVRQLQCGHLFHPHCIDHWLLDLAVTCPLWQVDPSLGTKCGH